LRACPRIERERGKGKERRAKQRRANETLHARDPFVADAYLAAMPYLANARPRSVWRTQLPPDHCLGTAPSVSYMTVT
jgi:hypothetical protein